MGGLIRCEEVRVNTSRGTTHVSQREVGGGVFMAAEREKTGDRAGRASEMADARTFTRVKKTRWTVGQQVQWTWDAEM